MMSRHRRVTWNYRQRAWYEPATRCYWVYSRMLGYWWQMPQDELEELRNRGG